MVKGLSETNASAEGRWFVLFEKQKRRFLGFCVFISLITFQGCAVHYYDQETGAEHVWGVGHMTMKANVPQGGQYAVVKGTDLLGLSVGKFDEGAYLSVGWDSRRRVEILDENTAIELMSPNGDLLNLRVSATRPQELQKMDRK
jgi:hypothetical protein